MLLIQYDDWSRLSRRRVPITRSAMAFAFGAWIGVATESTPMRRALTKVATVDGIAIAKQMPPFPAQGVASITWRQTQAAVGLAVMLTCTNSRRANLCHRSCNPRATTGGTS